MLSLYVLVCVVVQLARAVALPDTIHDIQPRSFSHIKQRACTVPANGLKNGGFESGNLSPWTFVKIYDGSPGSPFQGSVVNVGDSSNHSFQMSGQATPNDSGNGGSLEQAFSICEKVKYSLTWSLYQAPNSSTAAGGPPDLYVYVFPPNSTASPLELASFSFMKASYQADLFSAPGSGTFPAGHWRTYTAPFPFARTGKWKVQFELFTVADSDGNSGTEIRIDNVVAKPHS